MNAETADRINSAACRAWLFEHGLRAELAFDDIGTINSCSSAQIQTAADFVNAADDAQPSKDGKRTFRCTIDPDAAGRLKAYVATLPAAPQ